MTTKRCDICTVPTLVDDLRSVPCIGQICEDCDDAINTSDTTSDDDACPGCGCRPGDGLTAGCNHPDGCGYFRGWHEALGNPPAHAFDETDLALGSEN